MTHPDLSQRALLPDLIRAFALIGIVLVNVMGFSWPLEITYKGGALVTDLDKAADLGVVGLFMAKSYPLFSMMFGAGLAFQIASAERAGADFKTRYFRRMAGLFILGVLHLTFFWLGDILMTYALLGMLLYAMKDAAVKPLIWIGISMIVFNAVMIGGVGGLFWLGEAYFPEEMPGPEIMDEMSAASIAAFGSGGFWETSWYRLTQLPMMLIGVLFQQGISVFGFFCFGLAAVKSGAITDPYHPLWKQSRWVYFPLGIALSFAGAWLYQQGETIMSSETFLGLGVIFAASPLSALGYAGWIAKACEGKPGPIRRFFARAGSASLTAYLLQSIILSFVFSAYGLGLFMQVGAAKATAIAFAVGLFSLAFAGIWRSFSTRGPFEELLRRFTYGGDKTRI